MQSSLRSPIDSSPISWENPKSLRSRSSFPSQSLIFASSLESPFRYDLKRVGSGGDVPASVHLPIVIRRGGRASQYLWDRSRNRLQLVPFDREESLERFDLSEELHRLAGISIGAVRKLFVPQKVPGNYMDYLKWKFLHRVFSSTLQVLATQAMFRAIGVGFSRSLPSAAALNWVLKDGLGRLSRCIYTASVGSTFDTNLKRVRFSTSILFSLSIGVELLTPLFPQYFLLLATVANIAKSVSLAAYIATGSAIHRSFAIVDNLGEVSAKAQIQTVCFDNIGLMFAAVLNILCKNSQRESDLIHHRYFWLLKIHSFSGWRSPNGHDSTGILIIFWSLTHHLVRLLVSLPLVIYPIFASVELFAIYQGLKHVHLQTLNKDRLEIIVDKWIQSGFVPSPAEVSREEGVFFNRKGSKLWPIRIGCVDSKDSTPQFSMLMMQSLTGKDFYFICIETSIQGLTRKQQQGILLCLREKASTLDIVMGVLQACLVRKALVLSSDEEECKAKDGAASSLLRKWFKVVEDSKRNAREEVNALMEEIRRAGWAIQNILLNSHEQIRYSLVDD